MFTKITEIWPVIVAIAGAIGGVAYFIVQVLTMRKNKLEIEKLQRDNAAHGGMIYRPTNDEILKYGVSGRMRLVPSFAAVLCFCVLSTYLFMNYSSSPALYSIRDIKEDSSLVFNPASPQTTNREEQLAANLEELKNENIQLKNMHAASAAKEKQLIDDVHALKTRNEIQNKVVMVELKKPDTVIDSLKKEIELLKNLQVLSLDKEKTLNSIIEGLRKENSRLKTLHEEIQAKVIKLENMQKNKIQ